MYSRTSSIYLYCIFYNSCTFRKINTNSIPLFIYTRLKTNKLIEQTVFIFRWYIGTYKYIGRYRWIEIKKGCVVVPWHFEFYILKYIDLYLLIERRYFNNLFIGKMCSGRTYYLLLFTPRKNYSFIVYIQFIPLYTQGPRNRWSRWSSCFTGNQRLTKLIF